MKKNATLNSTRSRLFLHWNNATRILLLTSVLLAFPGCSKNDNSAPKPINARAFYNNEKHASGTENVLVMPSINPNNSGKSPIPAPGPAMFDPTAKAQPASATITPTQEKLLPSGQFQLVGSVVAEVNGTPIYANRVISLLNKPLMSKAREMNAERFKSFATELIQNQVQELVSDEVLYAAAERAITEDDKRLAESLTSDWRMRKITEAGGSIEIAKSRVAADGDDFDDLCKRQYRKLLIEVFRYRKIMPRIQVTVADMRRYYQKNVDTEFTAHAAAHFRLLQVSVEKNGTRENALGIIAALYKQAQANPASFADTCAKQTDDSNLAQRKGDLGMRDKGSLPPTLDKVESAVYKLKPGQISDIIDNGNSLFLAQLLEVRPGGVRPFDEKPTSDRVSVQDMIRDRLSKEQFSELSSEFDRNLRKDAIVRTDDKMINLCLDMVMQRYSTVTATN